MMGFAVSGGSGRITGGCYMQGVLGGMMLSAASLWRSEGALGKMAHGKIAGPSEMTHDTRMRNRRSVMGTIMDQRNVRIYATRLPILATY